MPHPDHPSPVSAVVLAAGLATRMQASKLSLPWGQTTVIGRVVQVLQQGGVAEVVVVTGGWRQEVEAALRGLPVRTCFNPHYADGHMTHSLQAGLRALAPGSAACLVALGDQPQIRVETVRRVLAAFWEQESPLVVPSFRMRRGHPWLVARPLWADLLSMQPPHTLRDFLNTHADRICYVDAPDESILLDLDTPDAYEQQRPA